MRRFIVILYFACNALPAAAWNAAGHRLTAAIAWRQLSPETQRQIGESLATHPDFQRWQRHAGNGGMQAIFAEAATWADSIRHDPRYYDENSEAPAPPIAGLSDNARHKNWHYVDIDDAGHRQAGEIDRRIEFLRRLLRTSDDRRQRAWALPWLLHLVGDIHQPLHVGRQQDAGGNDIAVASPAGSGENISNLHAYWDRLPGPTALRGRRLAERVAVLLAEQPIPRQGSVASWRDESRQLRAAVYPATGASLPLRLTPAYRRQAETIADRRLVAAGYRLGRLLEKIFAPRVPRETP